MATYNPNDPAIYGPVPGVGFVTLSAWTDYTQQQYAFNQQQAHDQFAQAEKTFGVSAPNPYVVPPAAGTKSSTTTSSAKGGAASHIFSGGGGLSDYCFWYPDDPLCDFYAGGGGGGGSGGGGGTINETIIVEGLGATDVNAAIDSGLSAVWGAVVGSIDSVIAVAIASIQGGLTAIANSVKAVFAVLSRLSGFILGFLKTLLHDVIHGVLTALQDVRKLFQHLVDDVLKPLAAALQKIRDRLLDLYKRFIRPALLVLQQIHRLLVILAAFHVGFARKLDAKLQALEAKFVGPFLQLLAGVNAVANFVNLIITANYLIQKPIWLASLKAYSGSTINAQLNAMNPSPNAAAAAALQGKYTVQPAAKTYTDFDQWAATGTGDAAPTIAYYGDQFDQLAQQRF